MAIKKRNIFWKFSLSLLLSFLFLFLYQLPWSQSFELKFLDLWFNLRGFRPPPEDIVIIAMDEDSYQNLNIPLNEAWPRSLHTKLLKRLHEANPKAVVFDVLFVGGNKDLKVDEDLASAFSTVPTVIGAEPGVVEDQYGTRQELLLPEKIFLNSVKTIGLVSFPEKDGFVRNFLLTETPSLSEAGFLISRDVVSRDVKRTSLSNPGTQDFINYYGPKNSIKTYSYYQVLDPEMPLPLEHLHQKIVFVGLMLRTGLGPTQKDSYLTPFSNQGRTFGVEIHATITANLLNKDWISSLSKSTEFISLFALATLSSLCLLSLSPLPSAILVVVLISLWASLAYIVFLSFIFLPGATLTLIFNPTLYLGNTLYYYIITRRSQRHIQKAFSHYLAPEMVKQLSQNPDALKLGGESIIGSAMFTDIEGFTSISENMRPEEVTRMLNEYFSCLMEAVFTHQGTLIKFIGDAIFVIWGAPVYVQNHAEKACKTALLISEVVDTFNKQGLYPKLHTRIGINSGSMVVGNLGSHKRFDYTAIGDTVNLASRIEGLNKYFGTEILISENSKQLMPDNPHLLKIGSIKAVGKEVPVNIYTHAHSNINENILGAWRTALAAFQSRKWQKAGEAFSQLSATQAFLKKACQLYLDQISMLLKESPDANWRGEIKFKEK